MANRYCNLRRFRVLVIMQTLRATSRWMQILRSVARPNQSACRSAHRPGIVQGNMYRRASPKRSKKEFQATVAPQSIFCRTVSSYAASVTPSESIEVDIMVEGSNQALDRCNRMQHDSQCLHQMCKHGKWKSCSSSQTGN